MQQLSPLWDALLTHAQRHLPDLYTSERVVFLRRAVAQLSAYQAERQAMPTTLVHNDITNPRNACFKGAQFCLYDWELATFHLPQYDVVEFLCFVLDQDRYARRAQYLSTTERSCISILPFFRTERRL